MSQNKKGYSRYRDADYTPGTRQFNYNYNEFMSEPNSAPERNIKDYLLVLREHIWLFLITLFVVFVGTVLYTFKATKTYKAEARVEVYRVEKDPLLLPNTSYERVANTEDFNTRVNILKGRAIAIKVAERLQGNKEEFERFMAPYQKGTLLKGPLTPLEVLLRYRSVVPVRLSLIISVQYIHPDPEIAANIANMLALTIDILLVFLT